MQNSFGREYRLRVESNKGNGVKQVFEFGKHDKNTMPLHISFDLERADSQILNTARISLWNLSKEHRDALSMMGAKVYLSAGYEDTLPQIFVGTVVQSTTERDGGNHRTTLECVDGFEALSDKVVSVSFSRRITAYELMIYIAEKIIGTPVMTKAATEQMKNTRAESYSYFGKAARMLDELCGASRTQWKILNGVLMISLPNEAMKTLAYDINADTGLIGFPKRIFESSVGIDENNMSTNSYSMIGWEISYLLNGAINVGDKVVLKSKEHDLDGTFYVYNVHMSGDNFGDEWKCTAQLREVGTEKTPADRITTGG